MTDEERFKRVIANLTGNSETWVKIKKILEDEIRDKQDLLEFLNKIAMEKEDKYSKLN